ncbi:hypothetical protein QWJ34_12475 [Saccharibacillus sp. CPCC 101409]|uniref:hypothetical protein n=1 Tax=Saccharibacillus sp. CPCC 101409 TaxID=3058041 RepID=UPI0026729BEE|nr:hypothetical protein [Saccharibacillus sp. CPCC 101409]MDO3410579.1 hypothetical protein [Saccharibacillus sp. CPCC 101409]
MQSLQAVFIDRDGTIGGTDRVILPGAFTLFPYVQQSMDLLKRLKIPIFSFTNQPEISRGEAAQEDFVAELLGFGFDQVYLCPHEHGTQRGCRKPAPGKRISSDSKIASFSAHGRKLTRI